MNARILTLLLLILVSYQTSKVSGDGPLKVFILAGQSNMQGHADVRTLEHLKMNPETEAMYRSIVDQDGKPRVMDHVWISYLSSDGVKHGRLTVGYGANENKMGPELTFGIRMHERLGEPILIIKTAWGGKSLNTDFRPPGAGPYVFPAGQLEQLAEQGRDVEAIKAAKAEATGHYYRLMLEHVKSVLEHIEQVCPDYDPARGYELAGFVWFQGWNDMVDSGTYPQRDQPNGYSQYSDVLAEFIREVRRDLDAPNLPFVVGVLGVNGPVAEYGPDQQRYKGVHQNFRNAMALPAGMPEFKGTVVNVLTEKYWDQELTELRARENGIRQQVKKTTTEDSLSKEDANALEAKLRAESFTERELATLANGISNQEYHYLGSAKILGRIGEAFADALLEINK